MDKTIKSFKALLVNAGSCSAKREGSMILFLKPRSLVSSIVGNLPKYASSSAGLIMIIVFMTFAQVSIPNAPELVYPLDNQTEVNLSIPLSWSESAWATWYNLQVSTDSNFLTKNVDTMLTTFYIGMRDIYLQYGATYYWRVNAENSNGVSQWGGIWKFSTQYFSPVLNYPLNYQTNVSINPELKWDEVRNAKSYRVQVASDSNFTSMIINDSAVTATSKTIGPLFPGTIYYWRVYAKSKWGVSSRWAERRAFATGPSTAISFQQITSSSYVLSCSGHVIKYVLPSTLSVSMKILDLQGKVVWHLKSTAQNAGSYCQNINHNNLRSGQYLLEFKAGSFLTVKKICMVD